MNHCKTRLAGTVDRRDFIKTGVRAAAGAAVMGRGVAHGAVPKDKKTPLTGTIPQKAFGKTGHTLPIFGFGGCGVVRRSSTVGCCFLVMRSRLSPSVPFHPSHAAPFTRRTSPTRFRPS